jgi:septal ring factor EnvC (AmiA/AmiB activator)
MSDDFSTMKDADMPLLDRIEAALARVRSRQGLMRIPVEATDMDIVVRDCREEINRLRADLAQRTAERDALAAEVADLKARLDTAWGDLADNERITDHLRDDIATLRAELAKAEAERDEARREACELLARSMKGPMEIAADRVWDCFDREDVQP